MVPAAAAFAEEPAEAAAEGNDVELLAATPAEAWQAGLFTAVDNNGKTVVDKVKYDEFETVAFANDGKAHWVVPTVASLAGGTVSEDLKDADLYKVTYYNQADGAGDEVAEDDFEKTFSAKGSYSVVVEGEKNTAYAGQKATINFTVGSKSLEDAEVYQVNAEDENDVSDKTFTYTGEDIAFDGTDLNLEIDGEPLEYATDYTATVYPLNVGNSSNAKNAGTYVAKIVGANDYAGENVTLQFEVEAMDLSTADIELVLNGTDKTTVDNVKVGNTSIVSDVDVTCTVRPGSWYGDKAAVGEYSFNISPKADNKNVKGSVSKAEVVATNKVDILYNGTELKNETIDLAKKQSFDLDKISVTKADDDQTVLDEKDYTVEIYDADGKKVDASSLEKAGKWTVKVVVDAKATEYEYAGEASAVVTVYSDTIDAADVFFKQDGKVVSSVTETFDGTDLLDSLSVTVLDSEGKVLSEGSDYTVTAKKDGEVVDSIVDWGTYKLVVESDTYKIGTEELVVTVNKVTANTLRIDPTFFLESGKVSYTGESLVPAVQYRAGTDANGEEIWENLPVEAYKLSYMYNKTAGASANEPVDEIKEPGAYTVTVADADADDNYTVSGSMANDDFDVTAEKEYVDVPNTEWYYHYVKAATEAQYMTGIGGTKLFAPNESTTRAMAATVLARMAGEDQSGVLAAPFENPFSDVAYSNNPLVDPWYAANVLWASSARIVTGYETTDGAEFRPDANVNRAEFCVMMQRYAKATMQGVDLAEGEADEILAKYEDGASVPAWAKDAVAWAVKNEIFGGYTVLDPMGDITRAQMAKMAVAFQAEPLKEGARG